MKSTMLLMILSLVSLSACTKETTSVYGTLVAVDRQSKACEFGQITLQPAEFKGGENLVLQISDMTKEREQELNQKLGKKVKIHVENQSRLGCNSSNLTVTEVD